MKFKLIAALLLLVLVKLAAAQGLKAVLHDMDTTTYGKNSAVGKYADIRGFKMYYEVYGNGEPMLFIHGNGGSIKRFLYQIPYFAKNHQVIIADSRAQGKSVDPTDSLSYEMMTDDLNGLLDQLHVKQCYVIGWSDGGINGLLLAIRHPDKVKKLAITGANLWPDTTAVDPFVYKRAMDEYEKLKKEKVTPEIKNQLKLAYLLSYEPHISIAQLNKITCPTLVIGGDHDVILPKHTMLIAESIPNSYLWLIPKSGHSTPTMKKDIFNQTVGDFFKADYRKIDGLARFF